MSGPGWGSGPSLPADRPPSADQQAPGWRPWSGGSSAASWPPWVGQAGSERPYTGPPPTGRHVVPVPYGALPPAGYGAPPWPGAGGYGMGPYGPGPFGAPPPAPGGFWPVTPPGAPPHDVPQPYLLLMRARDWAWWRPVLGLLLFTVVYMVAVAVLVVVAAVTGVAPDLALEDLTDPLVLLITNASLVVAIPIVWLCWVAAHGLRIGWSSSVLGRLRWRLLWPYTRIALLTLGLAVGITVMVTVLASGAEISGPDSSFVWLLLVVLLTTPLQAAAEEYLFRGYLSQAIAGWIGRPAAGAVVSGVLTAALFSLAHLPPDFLTFLDRFAIGLAFSAVVWLTGGLEAAIVLHAVNNVVIFILVGLLGDEVLAVDASSSSNPLLDWATVLLGILAMGAFVAWVARSRRRLEPQLLSPAVDLRGMLPAGPSWGMAPPWGTAAPWAPGPAGPPWASGPAGPPWAPGPVGPPWAPAAPPWGRPGPTWSPAPPSWVPPAPRSAPPPDDRWARPGAGPPGSGLAGGPHGAPPGGPGAARGG